MTINPTNPNRVNPVAPSPKPRPKDENDPKEPFVEVTTEDVEEGEPKIEDSKSEHEIDPEAPSLSTSEVHGLKEGADDEVLKKEAAKRAYGNRT